MTRALPVEARVTHPQLLAALQGIRADALVTGDAIVTELALQRIEIAKNTTGQADLAAVIAELVALLAPEPPPPPPPRLPLIGAATYTPADFATLEAQCVAILGRAVTIPVRRSFDPGGQWDVTRMASGRVAGDIAAGRLSAVSWATYPNTTALDMIGGTTPTGHRISLCFKHEVDRGKATPEVHAAEMGWITEVVHGWGRPEITTRVTFTGIGGREDQRARRWLDLGIADVVDHVSVDVYNTWGYPASDPDPGQWIEPDDMLGPWFDLATEYGFADRMNVDEHSCPEMPGDPGRKVASLRRLVELADLHGFGWVLYFDNEHGEISDGPDHRIKSSDEHLATFAGFAGR